MKTRKILWLMLALLPALSFAQDDDMYFVPKKSKTTKVVKTNTSQQQETRVVPRTTVPETQAEYYSGTLRDVDEYNRRGKNITIITEDDTIQVDESQLVMNEKGEYVLSKGYSGLNEEEAYLADDDYAYSARLSRFHGYGYPYYYSWNDPWYWDSYYYDPYYWGYRPWYYTGWHGYYGYYSPYYSWGWGYYPYAYHPHHPHHPHGGWNTASYRGGRNHSGRGYAMTGMRGRTGSSTGIPASRTGRTGSTSYNNSRGYALGSRSGGVSTSRSTTTGRSTSGNGVVRGIGGSSSRSTVSNSRGSSFSSGSSSSSGGSRSSGGGFSGGSRGTSGGGFSGGGGSRGGGRR